MYKSKLQELCHQKRWGLPVYSCLKDGAEHSPQFRASVFINGLTFVTPNICKSSKDAHNQAAKLAFLHFTSENEYFAGEHKADETHKIAAIHSSASDANAGQEPSSGEQKVEETHKIVMNKSASELTVDGSNAIAKSETEGPTIGESCQIPKIQSNAVNFKDNVQHQYKMKLQIYAKRNSLGSPSYTSAREGPPHALCFKSTVSLDGHSFASPGSYKTLKEAEHAAAQVALMSFSLDAFQQEDNPFYKNLLQELAQNEGFILPAYKTIKSGEPHKLAFLSIVEIEGEKFQGKAAKSKKQAELNAAKAAYIALMKRMSSQVDDLTSPGSTEEDETNSPTPATNSLMSIETLQNPALGCSFVSVPSVESNGKAEELKYDYQIVSSSGDLSAKSKVTPHELSALNMEEINGSMKAYSSSGMMAPPDLSALSIAESSSREAVGMSSYLLCNRVRVYTYIPDLKFPRGTVVLPIGKDKWVPVSLEFPNEINA